MSSRSEAAPKTVADRDWGRLAGAASFEDFANGWLAIAGGLLAADRGVLVARQSASERFSPLAFFPEGQPCGPFLADAAERALYETRPLVLSEGGRLGIAYPLMVQGRLEAIAGFEWSREPEVPRESLLRTLQWGLPWIESRVAATSFRVTGPESAANALHVALRNTVAAPSRIDAARAAATELARMFACELAAVGFAEEGRVALTAISNTSVFDVRQSMPQGIQARMNDAYRATKPLATAIADAPGHTLCLAQGTVVYCLERNRAFDGDLTSIEAACAALSPALLLHAEIELPMRLRLLRRARQLQRYWLGADAGRRRAVAGAAAVLLVLLLFAKGEFRVTGDATLEGSVRRVMTAPFDGYVAASHARAGDRVKKDAPIAALDDRDLRLERIRWASQQAQFARQFQEATAKHERGQMQITQAQLAQAEAQGQLLDEQLRRARITAPFDGLLVSGDLSQAVGGAVRKGDTLFEITPLSGYRVVVQVDESEIASVTAGQRGTLLLTSIAGRSFPITVTAVTPVAKAQDGRNAFRVEAALEGDVERLRPGMEGVAKIETGPRNLIWIWTHKFTNWLRLKAWSLWP